MTPCSICLGQVDQKSSEESRIPGVFVTRCGHPFHAFCIGSWLKTQKPARCAVCNSRIEKGDLRRLYLEVVDVATDADEYGECGEEAVYEIRESLKKYSSKDESDNDPPMSVAGLRTRIQQQRLSVPDLHHQTCHLELAMAITNTLLGGSMVKEEEAVEALFMATSSSQSTTLGDMDEEYEEHILPVVEHLLLQRGLALRNTRKPENHFLKQCFNQLNVTTCGFLVVGERDFIIIKKRLGSWTAMDATLLPKAEVDIEEIKSLFAETGDKAFIVMQETGVQD